MKNKFVKCFIGILALLALNSCGEPKRDNGITSQPSQGGTNSSDIYQPDGSRKVIYKLDYTIESKDNSEII